MLKNNLLLSLSSFLNYSSYHKYKRAVAVNNSILYLFAICLAASLFMRNAEIQIVISTVSFLLLIVFSFRDYWIEAKKRKMTSISSDAKRNLGLVSKKINLYDGIYSEDGRDSIEVSLFKDYTLIWAFFKAIKNVFDKERTSLMDKLVADQVRDLKSYVEMLKGNRQFVVYATMTGSMASQLRKEGLTLKALPRKYVTKPGLLNACANGVCRLPWKVPAFNAYMISKEN